MNDGRYNDILYLKKEIIMSEYKEPVFDLIDKEKKRQREGLELIPSENYVSGDVLRAMGSILTNKYSEGYPSFKGLTEWDDEEIASKKLTNHRYYGG